MGPDLYPTHRWEAFAKLTVDEREALMTLARGKVAYKRRTTIRSEGSSASGLYLLVRGWVSSAVMLPSGARLIQKVHIPGDILGATSMVLPQAADALTTITEASVAFVPYERLGMTFSRLPRLAAMFIFAAQEERLALIDALAVAGRASAKEQLARLLLDFHARLTLLDAVENNAFDFPLTQEIIGDLTGLTSVHVNRKMRELREEGPIKRQGETVQILDLAALRAVSPIKPRALQFEPMWLPPPPQHP